MEAVGRRKAHWLFRAGSEKVFSGKRRPQEDMVTSAVFGTIRLMSPHDRRKSLEVLLGHDICQKAGFSQDHDIDVMLWPRLNGLEGRRHVEPDVLLHSASKTAIVEVKWHAPLSERQLEQQIEAVGPENISAVVMLGEVGVAERILDTPCFRRTWRDVSGDLQDWQGEAETSLSRWVATMRSFLQETDMGRVFGGLPALPDPGRIGFRFRKSGYPPWLKAVPKMAGPTCYRYGS